MIDYWSNYITLLQSYYTPMYTNNQNEDTSKSHNIPAIVLITNIKVSVLLQTP